MSSLCQRVKDESCKLVLKVKKRHKSSRFSQRFRLFVVMEETFRQFYNHTIYPELYRMERRRRRLWWMLLGVGLLALMLIVGGLMLKMKALVMLLMLPVIAYFGWLGNSLRKYVKIFKPRVVLLILDYIDNQMSYDTLKYFPEKGLSKKEFLGSGLYVTKANNYEAEDYISGKIGDVAFEMCEVRVSELAGVQSGVRSVFSGMFFKAVFDRPIQGAFLIVPRKERAKMNKAIKKFNLRGGRQVQIPELEAFNEEFLMYRTLGASVSLVVSLAFCESILNYYLKTGEHPAVFISGAGAYAVLPTSKDMLEPSLYSSNLKFEKINDFYSDLTMLLDLIKEIDKMF